MTTSHQQTTNQSQASTNTGNAGPEAQLPALVEKAKGQLEEYLKNGAHVLCPLQVTDPPMGYYPKVVAVTIDPNPAAKEVYVKDKGFGGKPDTLELSKIALMKLADTIGVTWDERLSRRIDDGSNPLKVTYKAVGYIEDYLGNRRTVDGTKTIDLDAIRDDLINTKTKIADAYKEKMGTSDEKDVPYKWRQAFKEGRVDQFITDMVRDELIKKRLFLFELAETGAKLRAIRNKGVRTTYTAAELAKPFVDVRYLPLHPTPERRYQAERAYDHLYGAPPTHQAPSSADPQATASPHDRPARQPETIDATWTTGGTEHEFPTADAHKASPQSEPTPPPEPPGRLASDLADFAAMEPAEQASRIQELGTKKKFPVPKNLDSWSAAKRLSFYEMLLKYEEDGQSEMFGKGGQS